MLAYEEKDRIEWEMILQHKAFQMDESENLFSKSTLEKNQLQDDQIS